MLLRALAAVTALYVAYAGIFFLLQRTLLYPGTRLGPGPSWQATAPDTADAERVSLESPAGPVRAWFVPASEARATGTGALVFHGNAELAVDLVPAFGELADLGVSTLFVEYPGFGGEPGRPTESSIMDLAEAAWDALAARDDVDEERIFAFGRSLGTGPAAGLTRRRRLRALVLWSPFVSIGHLALRKYGLPPFLALDRFDNRSALGDYGGPVLLFHGRSDRVIPFSNSQALARVHRDARLVEWSCGHNDCPPAWAELWGPLADFLAEARLATTARRSS